MSTLVLKRGDLAPAFSMQLLDGDDPVNLAGATVRLVMRRLGSATPDLNRPAEVADAANGIVRYAWQAGETDTAATYLAEWEVTWGGGAPQTFPGDGYATVIILADLNGAAAPVGSGYCTVDQARAEGAQGSDLQVLDAILAAGRRVDRYTGETWAPQAMTLYARVGADGVALLPRRVVSVASVTLAGASQPLPVTAYRVTSSNDLGGLDAVALGTGWADPLIAGAEPWAGGWDNLLRADRSITVVGTFGRDAPPPEVVRATALIAADITTPHEHVTTDDEGNAVTITRQAGQVGRGSTGVPAADDLLAPLRAHRVRFS